jgi:hypothetical protein
LSLTNAMWIDRDFSCSKRAMKSASGDDTFMKCMVCEL